MKRQLLTPARLFDLIDQGVFSTLVLTHAKVFNQKTIEKLLDEANTRYQHVTKIILLSEAGLESLEAAFADDCVFLLGLDGIDAHHNIAFTIRSLLDTHRKTRIIIFLSDAAFQSHFSDIAAPFYQFCHRIKCDDGEYCALL